LSGNHLKKMSPREFIRHYLWVWILLLLAAAAYYPRFTSPGGMLLYRHAAECVLTGQVLQICEIGFTYPPAFAFVMIPFALMPIGLAVFIWYLITLACTVVCCWLCEILTLRLFPEPWPERQRVWFRSIAIFISLKFILSVYEDQAYDLLILPLTLFGILTLADRRNTLAATSLGVAAAMKVTPLIFLPYLLFKRRYAAAAIFAGALLAVSFLPDLFFKPDGAAHGYFVTWVREIAAPGLFENAAGTKYTFWEGANPLNLSLRGLIALALDQTAYQADFTAILRAVQFIFMAVIGSLLLISMRWNMIPAEGALLIIAMLMLSPMSGRGHFVGLMLTYYLLVAALFKDRYTAWLGTLVLAVSFLLCAGIPRGVAPLFITEFMRLHSDISYGTLVLIIYLATIMLFPQRWGIARATDSPRVATAGLQT
jgi:hypothetical protein